MDIASVRVDHLKQPLGFRMDKPVFSYVIENSKGTCQTKGRVQIALDDTMSEPVYDSGLLDDMDPAAFRADISLRPRTRYFYQITAMTDAGETAVSPVDWFETGKMDEAWKGRFITCSNKESRLPIFTKTIEVRKPVRKARLYICGLGLYQASIDGKKVGNEYLTPYCNDYDSFFQVQTYDVTKQLSKTAELAVELGNGWFKGRFGFDPKKVNGTYGSKWALIAEVHLTYQDGSEDVIGTDTSWKVLRSKTYFSNIYDGEKVDQNLPDLEPEKARYFVTPQGEKDYRLRLMDRLSVPVVVQKKFKPKEIIHTPAGELVLDLGQEITGIFEIKADLKKGQTLHLQFGEILQDGNFFNLNLRSAKAEFFYTASERDEKEPAVIRPSFTFYGYRYVKVEGLEQIGRDDFTGLALWSDLDQIGTIKTGNRKINQLLSNVQWGQRDNFVDVPTDCPQRDERMGWTGDAEVFCPTASLFLYTEPFYRKYIYDMNQEQKVRDGAVPHVIPSFHMQGSACAWADAATIIPWKVYENYGDKQFLEDSFDGMKGWVDYVDRLEKDGHKWRDQFHFGDWLALDGPYPYPSPLGATDGGFLAETYFLYSTRLTAKAAAVLGREEDKEHYEELADRILTYIRQEYYTPNGRCAVDTQTGYLVTLWQGLWPDPKPAIEGLKKQFKWSSGKLKTGFIGTPILNLLLSKYGFSAKAYDLLFNEDYPGWLYEVNNGATTIWERWNAVLPDGKLSDLTMNSLNHYAYGSIAEWIWRWAAGLDQADDSVAYKKIQYHPVLDARMKRMKAELKSASGLWKSEWAFDGKTADITLTVPFGCSAVIELEKAPESAYKDLGPDHTVGAGTWHFCYSPAAD